jgi:hypothetical protein
MRPSHSIARGMPPRSDSSSNAATWMRRGTDHHFSMIGKTVTVTMKVAVSPMDDAQPNWISIVMSVVTRLPNPTTVVKVVMRIGSADCSSIRRSAVPLSWPASSR